MNDATQEINYDTTKMNDDSDMSMFAFRDIHYIPFGYSGTLAPYIESGPGTMRAAAELMGLGAVLQDGKAAATVICDLGCGDGEFLIGLLDHVNGVANNLSIAQGVGIDYDTELIRTAGVNSLARGVDSQWLVYDFNDDLQDLARTLIDVHHITHMFIYLVPKQLALKTVRQILIRLSENGVVLCCHKFYPDFLTPTRRDDAMNLVVYDKMG
ncbi:uncharacterized protein L3040_004699 [Drepanopeziza brunnea f. sp. 'multigermtubi']|uniref:uncharacterized protein n=1 Tax=Drepanopeziza brunnea f. sp. 'multigermtubi' TaxID=698441 RepID=UPI00239FA785|nr:hypothetical protein L3040_004699 [Drepanopeziza brunnea f. sp. 'multigermtubi']